VATILVVDDNPVDRYLLVAILTPRGHRVLEATDGAAGVRAALSERVNLVVSDLIMPGMDGYELANRLHGQDTLAALPVVFWTANTIDAKLLNLAEHCGVQHVLSKPMEPGLLAGAIESALSDGPAHSTEMSPEQFEEEHRSVLTTALYEKVEQLRASEAALRRTGERFRRLVEGMPDAVIAVDIEGAITMVNAATEQLFGQHRDELLGRSVETLLPAIDRDAVQQRLEYLVDPTAARPTGIGREIVAHCANATEVPVEVTLNAFETDEGALVIVSVRDISEAKNADASAERQQQLHQQQRLESLGQLAGGIAHDFNNLLMVITFSAELLRDAVAELAHDDTDRAALMKNMDQIDRAATSAANLTRQLLLFSRAQPVLAEPIDLNAHVKHLEELLRRSIEENVELVIELGAGLRAVLADQGRLEQLLVNLVVNARDAMPDGGRVEIRTSLILGSRVQLEVADTGTGMTPEVIERAFEPFFTTKTQGRGTGLGLATVYGIVTDLGGTIELDSTIGRGTRVLVTLPTTDDRPRQERAQRPVGGTGERLLLAEDEDDLRGALAEMLRGAGYAVVAAPTGNDAIEACQHGDFDLLITDVIMPGMSGRQLADRLWEDRPTLRVLFMSGYSNHALDGIEDLDRATDFVAKPVQRDELLSHIRTFLDRPTTSIT
jgi:PAS domain S-box-containing protein